MSLEMATSERTAFVEVRQPCVLKCLANSYIEMPFG
jgi:hypothetical protein